MHGTNNRDSKEMKKKKGVNFLSFFRQHTCSLNTYPLYWLCNVSTARYLMQRNCEKRVDSSLSWTPLGVNAEISLITPVPGCAAPLGLSDPLGGRGCDEARAHQ